MSEVKREYKYQFTEIKDILRGMTAIAKRCNYIFPASP